jgi:hypothetical protein
MGTGGSFPTDKADHSPPSSAKVKNGGGIAPLPHVFMAECLINYTQGQLFIIREMSQVDSSSSVLMNNL